ncbi:MAG: hypothetical protein AAFV51_11410 [Pseudomonadota bacterium]
MTDTQHAAAAELDRLAKARSDKTGEDFFSAYATVCEENSGLLGLAVAGEAPERAHQTIGKSAAGMSRRTAEDELDAMARVRAERTGEAFYDAYEKVCDDNPEIAKRAVEGEPAALSALAKAVTGDEPEEEALDAPTAQRRLTAIARELQDGLTPDEAMAKARAQRPDLAAVTKGVYG